MLNDYSEILIEYDSEALVVYISGLDSDGYWIELDCIDDVNDPEEYAEGYRDALQKIGVFATVTQVVYESD